jgi:23S rRNA (adenine2503-C2)-methyltransferase
MNSAALSELATSMGEPAYRGKQLARWVYRRGAASYDEMTDLPAGLRAALADRMPLHPLAPVDRQDSSDGATKLLLVTEFGHGVEAVSLEGDGRVSSCLSTAVGCPMGCRFCATGQAGYTTDLSAACIVDQILQLQLATGKRLDHAALMGMGEPLLNFEAVVRAIRLTHDEIGIGYRRISVSTVGVVPKMRELADTGLPVHLAVSLHAPTDSLRESLMPVNRKWPVHEVLDAARYYVQRTGRKVAFEYLLLDSVNDTVEQARRLSALVAGFPCFVNLIPFNDVETAQGFRRPSNARINRFRAELERHGTDVSQRVERGGEIDAACGQLKGKHRGTPIPLGLGFQNPPVVHKP